jgi:hypothetical protein
MQDIMPDQASPAEPARGLDEIREAARLAKCPQCTRPRPGRRCTASGDHLARFQRAERQLGLITRAELAAVIAELDVIAAHVIVPDGAQ